MCIRDSRYVVGDEGGDGADMEDLVEAEPPRRGVGSLDPVDHGANGVEQTADGDEDDHSGAAVDVERLEIEHGHPAQCDVDGCVQPPWRTDPEDAEQHHTAR